MGIMNKDLLIELYSVDKIKKLSVLMKQNSSIFTEEYLIWKYSQTSNKLRLLAISKKNGEFAGSYSVVKWNLLIKKLKNEVVQSVDTFVHPSYRKMGIFKDLGEKTLKNAKELNYKFAYGFTYHKGNAFRGFTKKLNWVDIGRFDEMFYILDFQKSADLLTSNRILKKIYAVGFWTLFNLLKL